MSRAVTRRAKASKTKAKPNGKAAPARPVGVKVSDEVPEGVQAPGQSQIYGITPIQLSRVIKGLRKAPYEEVEEILAEMQPQNLPVLNVVQKKTN